MFSWTTAGLIFVAYFIVDVLHASYIKQVTKAKPVVAATLGSMTYVAAAFGVINYTHNPVYILPLVLGSWCGIFTVVKFSKRD